MKQIQDILGNTIENVIFKRKGKAFAKIFSQWHYITTPSLATVSVPLTLNKTDKILLVSVHNQSKAIEVYFMQDIILERIRSILASHHIKQSVEKIYVQRHEN